MSGSMQQAGFGGNSPLETFEMVCLPSSVVDKLLEIRLEIFGPEVVAVGGVVFANEGNDCCFQDLLIHCRIDGVSGWDEKKFGDAFS